MIFIFTLAYYFQYELMLALLRFMARSERIYPTLRKTAIWILIH